MDRPTTAEIQERHEENTQEVTFGSEGYLRRLQDRYNAAHDDRGILLERLEVAEATIKSIIENPDFGSCMSVIKQRNEQIYDLEATIRAIGGLEPIKGWAAIAKYIPDSPQLAESDIFCDVEFVLWDSIQAILKETHENI